MCAARGAFPLITALNPPSNINQSPGGLSNPNNWYIRAVMDHLEESEGEQQRCTDAKARLDIAEADFAAAVPALADDKGYSEAAEILMGQPLAGLTAGATGGTVTAKLDWSETPRPEWQVPCTTLWWVYGETYLGRNANRTGWSSSSMRLSGRSAETKSPRASSIRFKVPRSSPSLTT